MIYKKRLGTGLLFLLLALLWQSCDIFGIYKEVSITPNYPCKDGKAKNIYPCKNIDLVAHLSPRELEGMQLNDLWGWTDPKTKKNYALVGLTNGIAFVDITKPSAPAYLGRMPSGGQKHQMRRSKQPDSSSLQHESSTWADIKVYKDHAFVVSEEKGHGLQIFDLRNLRNIPSQTTRTFKPTAEYHQFETAHNIVINPENGYAYAVGVRNGRKCSQAGGLHIINIQNPDSPAFAGCFSATGYIHDAQCVMYHGKDSDYRGKEVCFSANKSFLSVVDVSNKSRPKLISKFHYEGNGYTHQGWLTNNHNYFLLDDEFDEKKFDHNTKTYIVDTRNLGNLKLTGLHLADVGSIDHNLYNKNGYTYQSNYTSGLRILSLDKVKEGKLKEVAYFDTFPKNNKKVFDGSWSNYPFFNNGVVIVSDITGGLFILHPQL